MQKSTYEPKVKRTDAYLYTSDPGRYYGCLTKVTYFSALVATRAAYLLSEFRCITEKTTKEYEPYVCKYCGEYHIGRVNRRKRAA